MRASAAHGTMDRRLLGRWLLDSRMLDCRRRGNRKLLGRRRRISLWRRVIDVFCLRVSRLCGEVGP